MRRRAPQPGRTRKGVAEGIERWREKNKKTRTTRRILRKDEGDCEEDEEDEKYRELKKQSGGGGAIATRMHLFFSFII